MRRTPAAACWMDWISCRCPESGVKTCCTYEDHGHGAADRHAKEPAEAGPCAASESDTPITTELVAITTGEYTES